MVRKSSALLKQALQFTDERAKLEAETIDGIDVVKCAAWEVRANLRRPCFSAAFISQSNKADIGCSCRRRRS